MVDVITDVKGTLTAFKPHVSLEVEYFHANAINALMEIEGLGRKQAERRYQELVQHADKKKDPKAYKGIFVPAVSMVAELGYKNGELSLQEIVHDGVEEVLAYIKETGARIVAVGMSLPSSTVVSLATAGLDQYVDAAYQSSKVGSKEDGTAYRTIAEREGFVLENCMYLDDKLKQAEGAVRAGVGKALWVLDGKPEQETKLDIIRDFKEVRAHYDALR